jgi:hypothetical protein
MQGGAILADIDVFARKQIGNELLELELARIYKQLGPRCCINPLVGSIEQYIDCGMAFLRGRTGL